MGAGQGDPDHGSDAPSGERDGDSEEHADKLPPPFAAFDVNQTVVQSIGAKLGVEPKLRLKEESSLAARGETGAGEVLERAPVGAGHYRILSEIDRGGMGVVMRGHDDDLGRDVAVKILHEKAAQDPVLVQRFVEEAQIGGQLQHPGIVPVYELGLMADERPYFTMKIVKGRTLEALLAEREDPSSERRRFLAIFESVCQTMGYAHSRGVIHRDLKPSNVMVGAFGEVQLVDWGLAKVLTGTSSVRDRPQSDTSSISMIETVRSGAGSTASGSTAGSVMGTLSYMSPEQARGEVDSIDERTDVFALGGILCEILTGEAPYPGLRRESLYRAAIPDQDEVHDRLDRCGADDDLVALVRACLAPDPEDRPADAHVLSGRVAEYLAAVEERARMAQIEAAEARVKAANERRARRLTLGLAASIVSTLIVGGAAWVWVERDRAERRVQTEQHVASALGEAAFARGQSSWEEASLALARARAYLQAGAGGAALAERVAEESRALDRLARRESFRDELEAIRMRVERTNERKIEGYAQAFARQGVSIDGMGYDDVVAAIRGSGLAEEMARALVDWARLLRDSAERSTDEVRRLLRLAIDVDDHPLRLRMRHALLEEDVGELRRLAEGEASRDFSPMSAIVLADALWWLGEPRAAVRILDQAEQRHPDDFHLQIKLAVRYMNRQELADAFPHLKAALSLQPRNTWVLTSLGMVYREQGDLERALACGRRAVEVDPADAYSQHHLGATLEQMGEVDEAIECYRRGIALDPEYDYLLQRLGGALEDVGEPREAAEWYRKALEIDPDKPDLLNSIAWCLVTAPDPSPGEIDDALRLAERAVDIQKDSERLNTLGLCYLRTGLYEECVETLEDAVALTPGGAGRPEDFFFLAMGWHHLGEEEAAREWYARGERWMRENARSLSAQLAGFRDEAAALLGIASSSESSGGG